MSRIIAVTSGKGGTGKTTLAVNLAVQLAELGHRTCIFDADLGTANINIMLGINPKADIGDVVNGKMTIHDIMIHDPSGIDIIPGSSGVESIANLGAKRLDSLVAAFADAGSYDFYLFDTGAGISRRVIAFCLAAAELLLVITDEPTSLTDAYSLLKVLNHHKYEGRIKVVVNRCADLESARKVYRRFRAAVDLYLGVELEPLGLVFQDEAVSLSMQRQSPFIKLFPDSKAAGCVRSLAQRLTGDRAKETAPADIAAFWSNCVSYFNMPLELPGQDADPEEDNTRTADARQEEMLREVKRLADNFAGLTDELTSALKSLEKAGRKVESEESVQHEDEAGQQAGERPIYFLDLEAFVAETEKK